MADAPMPQTMRYLEAVSKRRLAHMCARLQGQCANWLPCEIQLSGSVEVTGTEPYLWMDNLVLIAQPEFQGESLLYVKSETPNLWALDSAFVGREAAEGVPNGVTMASGGAYFYGALCSCSCVSCLFAC